MFADGPLAVEVVARVKLCSGLGILRAGLDILHAFENGLAGGDGLRGRVDYGRVDDGAAAG